MLKIVSAFAATLRSALTARRDLALENLALRHQLAILTRSDNPQRFRQSDRLLWIAFRRFWHAWKNALVLVQPATVVRWHRQGFRRNWRRRSRRTLGRPTIHPELRALIRRMASANPLWGAPRIHGERLKLGIEVSERTVSRCMPERRKPPSPTWRAFLDKQKTATSAAPPDQTPAHRTGPPAGLLRQAAAPPLNPHQLRPCEAKLSSPGRGTAEG